MLLSETPQDQLVEKIHEIEGIAKDLAQEFVDHKMHRSCVKTEPPCPGCGAALKTWHAVHCLQCDWTRDEDELASVDIRLSAQRALLGAVPSSLKAFSVEVLGNVIRTRSVFDGTETQDHKELLSGASAEIIADFPATFRIEDDYLSSSGDTSIQHLQHLIFQRHAL